MGEESVTDLSYLREVAMGDEEIVAETVRAFLEDAPNGLANLKTHFSNQNWEKLAAQAHKIKPNLDYMGMKRAKELILEIEEQAKTESISDDLGDHIREFDSLCQTAFTELSEKVEQLESV